MKIEEFIEKVAGDAQLTILAKDEEQRAFWLGCNATGAKYTVLYEAIEENDWELIREVLYGLREARALKWMTRIVGYFSTVDNWNKSKVAELRARRAAAATYVPGEPGEAPQMENFRRAYGGPTRGDA